jgi:hypothetical protein
MTALQTSRAVFRDTMNIGPLDPGETSTITDGNGRSRSTGLPAGTMTVRQAGRWD